MKQFSGLKFTELKNCLIADKDGENVGRLIDAVFKMTNEGLELTKFTVGGSRWEELLEYLKLRDDVDPVFSVDVIENVSPKRIRLNVVKDELEATGTDSNAIEEGEVKLSSLGDTKLLDSNNENIGNIIDMKFSENKWQFIVGDGPVLEVLEDWGFRPDVDFALAPKFIESIGDNAIKLNSTKQQLQEIFNKHAPDFKRADVDTTKDKQGGEQRKTFYFPRNTF